MFIKTKRNVFVVEYMIFDFIILILLLYLYIKLFLGSCNYLKMNKIIEKY